ncbi:MAG TPA: DUF3466 family protein [Bryobacteraceae bacterium]|nr:DUF3466 family protein [Bryobacteraceae bacterium]
MRCLNVIPGALAIVLLLALGAIGASAAQLSTFPIPDYANSWAFGINDNGYVVGAAGRGGLGPKGYYYGADSDHAGQWEGNIVTGVLYGKGHVTWLGSSGYYHDPSGDGYATTFTFATGINNAGLIAGITIYDAFDPHTGGFTGTMQSGATAINNKGQIVGASVGGPGGPVIGYLLDEHGQLTDLGAYGSTLPNSVNDASQIVGTALLYDYSPSGIAFLYQNGTFTELGSLGGGGSDALDINNPGKIVGYSHLSNGGQHAFLYSSGVMKDLGTLGGTSSKANAINNQGEIVGESTLADGTQVAFLYVNGRMIDLNSFLPVGSGWTLNEANDINNFGEIVGDGTFDGRERAFILDTTPEPATLALIGAGAILLGTLRKRCRRLSC